MYTISSCISGFLFFPDLVFYKSHSLSLNFYSCILYNLLFSLLRYNFLLYLSSFILSWSCILQSHSVSLIFYSCILYKLFSLLRYNFLLYLTFFYSFLILYSTVHNLLLFSSMQWTYCTVWLKLWNISEPNPPVWSASTVQWDPESTMCCVIFLTSSGMQQLYIDIPQGA